MRINGIFWLVVIVFFIVGLFVLSSYLVRSNINIIQSYVGKSFFVGAGAYVLASVLSIVFFPFATISLIPIATDSFGWFFSGLFSLIAWTIGAVIAFYVGRKYGTPVFARLVSRESMQFVGRLVPKKNFFWTVVLLRIVLPSDVVSYALGIFTKASYRVFIWTAIIGLAPSAFYLAYVGGLSLAYELIALAVGVVVSGIILWALHRK